MGPQEVYAYLCRVMYNRRNKFDPLWNSLVVAGIEPPSAAAADADASSSSHSFLGMVGMIGTHYSDSHVTTGELPAVLPPSHAAVECSHCPLSSSLGNHISPP